MIPVETPWLWWMPILPIALAGLGFPLADRLPRAVVVFWVWLFWAATAFCAAAAIYTLIALGGEGAIARESFKASLLVAKAPKGFGAGISLDAISVLALLGVCAAGTLTMAALPFASGGGKRREQRPITPAGLLSVLLVLGGVIFAVLDATLTFGAIAFAGTSFIASALFMSERPRDEDLVGVLKLFALHRLGDTALLFGLVLAYACFDSFAPRAFLTSTSLSPVIDAEQARVCIVIAVSIAAASRLSPLIVPSYFRAATSSPSPTVNFLHSMGSVFLALWLLLTLLPAFSESERTWLCVVSLSGAALAALRSALSGDILRAELHTTQALGLLSLFAFAYGRPSSALLALGIALVHSAVVSYPNAAVIEALHGENELKHMGGLWRALRVSDFTRALCAFSTSALPAGGLFLVIVPMLFYAMGDAHFFAGLVFVAVTQTYAGYRLFYLPFAGEKARAPMPSLIKDTDLFRRVLGALGALTLVLVPLLYATPSSLMRVLIDAKLSEALAQIAVPSATQRTLFVRPLMLSDRLAAQQVVAFVVLVALAAYFLARYRFKSGLASSFSESVLARFFESFFAKMASVERAFTSGGTKTVLTVSIWVRTLMFNFLLDGVLTRVTSGALGLLRVLTRLLHSGDVQRAFAVIIFGLAFAFWYWGGA